MSITENTDIDKLRKAILKLNPDEVVVGKGKSQKVLFKKYKELKAQGENKPGRSPKSKKSTSSDESSGERKSTAKDTEKLTKKNTEKNTGKRTVKIVDDDDDSTSSEKTKVLRGKPSMGTTPRKQPTKKKVVVVKDEEDDDESTTSSSDTEPIEPTKRRSILNKDKSESSANVIREMQQKKSNKKVKFAIKGASEDTEARIDEIDNIIDYVNEFSTLRDSDAFTTPNSNNKGIREALSHSFDYIYNDYLQQAKINKKRALSMSNFVYRLAAQLSNDNARPPYTSGDLVRAIDIIARSNFVGSSVSAGTMAEEIMEFFGVAAYDEAVVGKDVARAAQELFDDDYESVARGLVDIQDPATYVKGDPYRYRSSLIKLYDLYADKAEALGSKVLKLAQALVAIALTESLEDITGSELNIVVRRVAKLKDAASLVADKPDDQFLYDRLVESYGPTGLDVIIDAEPDLVQYLPELKRRPLQADEDEEEDAQEDDKFYVLYILSDGQLSTVGIRLFGLREDAVKAAGKILKSDGQSVLKGLRDLKNKGTTNVSGGELVLEEIFAE